MKDEIILYQPNEPVGRIEVRIDGEKETVWLTQEQLSLLFERDRTVITRYIRNIFKEGELDKKSNVQKMHIPNSDKPTTFYNLERLFYFLKTLRVASVSFGHLTERFGTKAQ